MFTQKSIFIKCLLVTDPTEKAMATHSSALAWKIPWAEEPGRLPSMGLHRADTTEVTLAAAAAATALN